VIEGQKSVITGTVTGELSKVPYAEPTWLANGYFSPYFKEVLTIPALLSEIMTGSLLSHFTEPLGFAEGNAKAY
jgi:hypothetical protein